MKIDSRDDCIANSSFTTLDNALSVIKLRRKNSEMTLSGGGQCSSICTQSRPVKEVPSVCIKRHNYLPCDYVSKFHSLTLDGKPGQGYQSDNFHAISESSIGLPFYDCDSESIYYSDTISISSENGNESQFSYQSSLQRPNPKRIRLFSESSRVSPNSICSVLDEKNDIPSHSEYDGNSSPASMNIDINKSSSVIPLVNSKRAFKYLSIFSYFCLGAILLATSIGLLFLILMSICEQENKQTVDFNCIEGNISRCIIGQEYIIPVIADAFKLFNADLKYINLMWWVGPIGVGKSYTKQLLRDSVKSNVNIYSIINTLLPRKQEALKKEAEILVERLSYCLPNIIFIDGFDEDDEDVLLYLDYLLESLIYKNENRFYRHIEIKILIIVIGSWGSHYITDTYTNYIKKYPAKRVGFNYSQLQQDLLAVSPFSALKIPFHFTTVPFLPLEFTHVKKCVIQQLNYILRHRDKCISEDSKILNELLQRQRINLTVTEVQDNVLQMLDVRDNDIILLGCKRVYHIVSSLLFNLPNN